MPVAWITFKLLSQLELELQVQLWGQRTLVEQGNCARPSQISISTFKHTFNTLVRDITVLRPPTTVVPTSLKHILHPNLKYHK